MDLSRTNKKIYISDDHIWGKASKKNMIIFKCNYMVSTTK